MCGRERQGEGGQKKRVPVQQWRISTVGVTSAPNWADNLRGDEVQSNQSVHANGVASRVETHTSLSRTSGLLPSRSAAIWLYWATHAGATP